MNRLGFAGRVTLLVALMLLVVQLASLGAWLSERRAVPERRLLPFPDQVEALVQLFDDSSDAQRALLIRALENDGLRLAVHPHAMTAEDDPLRRPGEVILPGLSQWLADFSTALGPREVRVAVLERQAQRLFPNLQALMRPEGLRASIRLADGDWLVIERLSPPGLTVAGRPAGIVLTLLSVGVALFTIWMVWRGTRPLRDLTRSVAAFGRDLQPRPLTPPAMPDLKALVESFNAMQHSIARADRARADMIAALSHDIRTPLARLALRLRKLDPDQRTGAERDIAQITRVAEEAFRFTEAEMASLDADVDLRAVLSDLCRDMGVPFLDETAGKAVRIRGNAALLARGIGNLVENAQKYARGCRVRLRRSGSALEVTVEDDGPGIPAADRLRLLEPFQRGDPARGQADGSGLGLSLAQRIVLRHGGQLVLQDGAAGGLTVRVSFPVAAA